MSWGASVEGSVARTTVTATSGNYPLVGVATPMISAVILVIGDATPTTGVIPMTSPSSYILGDIV